MAVRRIVRDVRDVRDSRRVSMGTGTMPVGYRDENGFIIIKLNAEPSNHIQAKAFGVLATLNYVVRLKSGVQKGTIDFRTSRGLVRNNRRWVVVRVNLSR